MKRIWNALRYGDAETRKCIGSVVGFSALGIILIVISAIASNFYLFIFGLLSVMVAAIVSQTFTLVDDDFVAEIDKAGDKDTVRSVTVKKTITSSGQSKPHEKKDTEKIKEHKKKPEESEKDDKKDNSEDDKKPEKKKEAISLEKPEAKVKPPKKPRKAAQEEPLQPAQFKHYSKKALERVKRKYRVRKEHRPIIIDSSVSYGIKECPAFMWRIHNKVYLLLLEKEPRRISISRDLIRHMGYEPNVEAGPEGEYEAFKKESLVTSVFKEFLPDYKIVKGKDGKKKVKNLYTIYPDIHISNRSANDVLDLLCLNFMPEDKITKSDALNGFFKRIYAAQILYMDQVYEIMEYKESVENTLKDMCYAEMSKREFTETLDNLVKGKLISKQYANYYLEMRNKIAQKREDDYKQQSR